jgi:hypothetical protein
MTSQRDEGYDNGKLKCKDESGVAFRCQFASCQMPVLISVLGFEFWVAVLGAVERALAARGKQVARGVGRDAQEGPTASFRLPALNYGQAAGGEPAGFGETSYNSEESCA